MTRPIDWYSVPDLRTTPDAEIAARVGCSASAVKKHRLTRGILKAPEWRARGRSPIDWDAQPLGLFPDELIARAVGVHVQTVIRARRARRIMPILTRRTTLDLPIPVYEWVRRKYPDLAPQDAAISLLTRLALDAGVKIGPKR